MDFPSICFFCQRTILDADSTWGNHHSTAQSVFESTESGCYVCGIVYGPYATKHRFLRHAESKDWPLYRWSLRKPGQTRESAENLALIFRPTREPPKTKNKLGEDTTDTSLPEVTFYLYPDDDSFKVPTPHTLGTSTSSSQTVEQAKKWLDECKNHHPKCRKKDGGSQGPGKQFLPTRLLDINCPPGANIRVVETRDSGIKGPYATLSHCWGIQPFVNLTLQNQGWFKKQGVKWSEIPLNFQHAIEVARNLGIHYIWIDSLTIIQGKNGDFLSEAPLIHHVYRNSHCSIAATSSPNAFGGLYRERKPIEILPARCTPKQSTIALGGKKWLLINSDYWRDHLLTAPLYTRSWVFQERMLAPRIIHYSAQQVLWDCASLSASESLPLGLPRQVDYVAKSDRHWRQRLVNSASMKYLPLYGTADDSLESFWRYAVNTYTKSNLTNGGDKLIAIWGVAKLVRDALDEKFLAGLWEGDFVEQLTWRVVGGRQANGAPAHRPMPLRQPSWTWASIDGEIELATRFQENREVQAVDHNGQNITTMFETDEEKERLKKTGEDQYLAWGDRLQKYSNDIAEAEKRFEERPGQTRQNSRGWDEKKHRELAKEEDMMPELDSETRVISIQCYVGLASVIPGSSPGDWTFDFDSSFKVFPDVFPSPSVAGLEQTFFALLAESGGSSDPDDDDNFESNEDTPATYSGVGILMHKTSIDKERFQRHGSFRYNGISETSYAALKRSLGKVLQDMNVGLKFWLE